KYRTQAERDGLNTLDCNLKFKSFLLEEGIIDEQWLDEIEIEHKEIVNQAIKEAEKAPYTAPEETYTYVYEEGSLNNGYIILIRSNAARPRRGDGKRRRRV